jgi:hypothetical protein
MARTRSGWLDSGVNSRLRMEKECGLLRGRPLLDHHDVMEAFHSAR